ncbi:MAG TPA: rhomboid family intramembrane serine protease [Marmoricola sp.]|nr:rhomboid family intramembrane serine protease [Marmoricola sp.]
MPEPASDPASDPARDPAREPADAADESVPATVAVRRRVPVAVPALLVAAVAGTVLWHTAWPGLGDALGRDGLRQGEVWRAVTPVLVQTGPVAVVVVALVLVALVGWPAERWFGTSRTVLLLLAGAVVGNVVGAWWDPHGAGVVPAGCGVLGGFAVWWLRMRRSGPVSAGGWVLLIGVFLAVSKDVHGLALLAGAAAGAVVLRGVPAVYRGRVRG